MGGTAALRGANVWGPAPKGRSFSVAAEEVEGAQEERKKGQRKETGSDGGRRSRLRERTGAQGEENVREPTLEERRMGARGRGRGERGSNKEGGERKKKR